MTTPDWLIEGSIVVSEQTIDYSYDREADMMEIIFQRGGGLGVDLTEQIVLRYNQESGQPLSLIFTDVDRLNRPTPFGPPSFRLTVLTQLPPPMQQTVLQILRRAPVNYFLQLSGLSQPASPPQPITFFNQPTSMVLRATVA